jgi:hypothetical protein
VAAVFQELHRPVYGIYAIGPDRDAIHDLLASSFSGRELTREYVEHYATLVRMQQERTSIDVVRVDYERVEAIEIGPEQIRVDADWSVGGIITHRNHKHPRVNRYRAVYTLARGDDGIRIVSTRMRNLQRMRTPVVNAGDWPFDEGEGSGGGFLDPVDYLMSGMYDKDKAAPAGGQPTDPFALPVEPTGQPADPFGLEVGEPTGQEGSP